MAEGVFLIAFLLVLYTYVGYPAIMGILARVTRRDVRKAPIRPTVTVLIVAHNEACNISQRIENCLDLEYPPDRLEIVVASDGSSDGTLELARAYESKGVKIIGFPLRRGKPAVINDVILQLRSDLVVLSDARQTYAGDALCALVSNFADSRVGAVSGELILRDESNPVGAAVGFYWRYEKFIRRSESRWGSTVGATGAIYAIRRELFESLPPDTLLDDVLIPLHIARRGYRVVFEPAAQAFDRVAAGPREEFTRKVRTITGNFQMFAREWWLLNPFANRLWFQTVSHKGLRLVAPALLLGILGANVFLLDVPPYRVALAGQGLFYLAALGGCWSQHRRGRGRWWLNLPYLFCLLNVTTVVSFYRWAAQKQGVTWTRASGQ